MKRIVVLLVVLVVLASCLCMAGSVCAKGNAGSEKTHGPRLHEAGEDTEFGEMEDFRGSGNRGGESGGLLGAPLQQAAPADYGVIPLTVDNSVDPMFSPDGTKIAYMKCGVGKTYGCEIWVMDADGSNKYPVTDADVQCAHIEGWSPDDTKILFRSYNPDWTGWDSVDSWPTPPNGFVGPAHNNLWYANADGSGVTQLTFEVNGSCFGNEKSLNKVATDFSPDGTKIAFTKGYYEYNPSSGNWEWSSSDLWVMDADGSNPVQLTDTPDNCEKGPLWSPDGSKILYRRCDHHEHADLWVIDADGTNATCVVTYVGAKIFGWSPDGQWIVYEYARGYSANVYKVRPDSTGDTRLTPDDEECEHTPTWFWSGCRDTILYTTSESDETLQSMMVMGSDGADKTVVHPFGNRRGHDVSPDGDWIVFQTCWLSGDDSTQLYKVQNPLTCYQVTKTVWDPENETWVKALAARFNDTLRFNCTILNNGLVNLTQLRFWDSLDCSLEFAGNATLNGTPVSSLSGPDPEVFKLKVMHPDNLSWDPYDPQLGTESFVELCPDADHPHVLHNWEDTNEDGRISFCDQVYMESGYVWYHVENVPYTLNLTGTGDGAESIYVESLMDYEVVNLDTPNGTRWLPVCTCKAQYSLENWSDNGDGNLSAGDSIWLREEETGESTEYQVTSITIDLVVSKEWLIDELAGGTVVLEPDQFITIEYTATVVRCGEDRNTARAKGKLEGESNWTYCNEDVVIIITVPCPSGDAANDTGQVKDEYTPDEEVYAVGSGFTPDTHVDIYVVDDYKWDGGEKITDYTVYASAKNVLTDGDGNIGVGTPVPIWADPVQGEYDMVFDANQNEYFDEFVDAVDHPNHPGFIVTGSAPVERAPLLMPLGIAALIGLLSIIASTTLLRRRKR